MADQILKVSGSEIVLPLTGNPIRLVGVGLGGYMNLENFITGFPGHESEHRAAMLSVLGKEKYEIFWEKFMESFFAEEDVLFLKGLGLNCLRVPVGYKWFEDDMAPRQLKVGGIEKCKGFRWLDRVVDLCAKHHIYTIIDMHSLPGAQNPDWHSDNPTTSTLFWEHLDFQDRTVWLWKTLASHYKDNPWIAGYNLINEPCDPLHYRLPAFYDRLDKEIRKVDPQHILFLDANTFAMEWKFFEPLVSGDTALTNCVFSLHDYSSMGFPSGEQYGGSPEQKAKLEAQFLRKATFIHENRVAGWNGEFGPVYEDKRYVADAEEINEKRYELLGEQLAIYDKHEIGWSIWTYKDIGLQGMVYVDPESRWMRTIKNFLDLKRESQIDAWGVVPSERVEDVMRPLVELIKSFSPDAGDLYPTSWTVERHLARATLQTFLAKSLQMKFAKQFQDMRVEDLEECAMSFKFDRCLRREGLNAILIKHAKVRK